MSDHQPKLVEAYISRLAKHKDEEKLVRKLRQEIKRLREALEDIKKHQEIASGTLSSLSATYHIVSKALEVK